MNYQFGAANVNFGDPNAYPSNPVGTQALSIPQMPTAQQPVQQAVQNNSNKSFAQKLSFFLNSKTTTILAIAIGLAIGLAFKELVSSIVTNVLQPLIIMFLSMTQLNNMYDFTLFISPEKNTLNVITFISTLFSFGFVVIATYYISSML
jgi:large-conductance mechanosensitive channel